MTNVIIAVHLAKISGESCLSDAGYKGDRICFWNLGVCLKPLDSLCKAVVEASKRKTKCWDFNLYTRIDVHAGVFI